MYLQIVEQMRRRIASGDWPAGHEIPSIRAMAVATKVSVITVKRAYLELERAGVIVTRQGKGSFVADTVDLGRQLKQEELDEHLRSAIAIGKHLGLGPDELVHRLREAAEVSATEEHAKTEEQA
jgi:GntR family transcriptional regulator